jgi:ABC-type sugar transport system ATPase subunit
MVALVGLSGSGKTSLVSLILRFYDVKSGSISLGGHDITTLDPTYLRAKVATVPQEPALFSVSMHDNIAYGLPNVSRAEVEAAASLANAHGFISAMPGGFDTVVGTRGITLSGGAHARIQYILCTHSYPAGRFVATCDLLPGTLCYSQHLGRAPHLHALGTVYYVCMCGRNKQTNEQASVSASQSPVRCCANRPCSSSTRRRPPSIQ